MIPHYLDEIVKTGSKKISSIGAVYVEMDPEIEERLYPSICGV